MKIKRNLLSEVKNFPEIHLAEIKQPIAPKIKMIGSALVK